MDAPRLQLDWEEGLYKALSGLWRRLVPLRPTFDQGRAATLEPLRGRLTVVAQVIAGAPVQVIAGAGAGGVRGRDLLLPTWMDLAPTPEANSGLYVLRAALSAAIYRAVIHGEIAATASSSRLETERLALRAVGEASLWLAEALPSFAQPWEEARSLALAARPPLETLRGRARVIEGLRRDALRGASPWRDALAWDAAAHLPDVGVPSPPVPLWGELLPRTDLDDTLGQEPKEEEGLRPPSPRSEGRARPVNQITRVQLDPRDQEIGVLSHTFEKVETADSYHGGGRDTDGSDELADHADALEEVDLGHVMRGGDPAESVLHAEIAVDAQVPDVGTIAPGEQGLPFDEWDSARGEFRPGWCTVYPTPLPPGDGGWAHATLARRRRLIEDLRRQLLLHRTTRRPLGRQMGGEEVDVEAMVDNFALRRSGHAPDERVYVRRERHARDVATTLLLDISLSTDGWVDNRRVLDVVKEAALVLGEVTLQLGDQVQILAFASHTRHRCRVFEVCDFSTPWSLAKSRLGALAPQGYTRIGGALRYATRRLALSGARRKLLLLISDGKPTDYDRYEGRYGMGDVRHALTEARERGITPYALAVDARARDYLPATFGPGAWQILPHPDRLPEVMTAVYARWA